MTLMEFFGCTALAFGPPISLFIFTIAIDPLRVIVLMTSAFFWLLSLLLSSLLWFAVVPLREQLAFGLVFSVLFQELFRALFYFLLRKADEGLKKVSQEGAGFSGVSLTNNKHLMSYVSGFGFGIISGAFSMVNVLADSTGPGTVGIHGDSQLFLVTSALLTLCFIFLHVCWSVVMFNSLDGRSYVQTILVVISHLAASCLTLLNQGKNPLYYASIIPSYVLLVLMIVWSYLTAGGSLKNISAFFSRRKGAYNM